MDGFCGGATGGDGGGGGGRGGARGRGPGDGTGAGAGGTGRDRGPWGRRGRRTVDPVTGRRFRPLAQETREGRDPSSCRRTEQSGPCCAAATSRQGRPACERGRTSRIIGLAARLGDSCTAEPPPLVVLPREPREDGP